MKMSSRTSFRMVGSGALCCMIPLLSFPAKSETLRNLTSVQFVGNVPFDTQLAAAKRLQVGGVRIAVRWSDVEKRAGKFDWHGADSRAGSVIRNGFTPIITLFGSNGLYGKLTLGETRTSPLERDAVEAFARFSKATVAHFGTSAAGRPIYYEIWNEPNTKTFWSVPPNPERYASMALSVCQAIKHYKQDATVLGLAMEGTPVKAPYFVPAYGIDIYQQWADRAATPELTACLSGVSMHPYRDNPDTYLSDEEAFRAFMLKHWAGSKAPIIVNSEWGYKIDLKEIDGADRQAKMVIRTLMLGVGLGRLTNLYQIVDGGRDPDKPDETYGLFKYDGSIKPAGEAIERLMHLLGDYQVDGISTINGRSALVVRFHREARPSDRAAVVWSTKEPVPVLTSIMFQNPVSVKRVVDLVSGNDQSGRTEEIIASNTPIAVFSDP